MGEGQRWFGEGACLAGASGCLPVAFAGISSEEGAGPHRVGRLSGMPLQGEGLTP